MVLCDCLQQFGMYNVFKDDSHGIDLVQDIGPNNGILFHKFLAKHAFILRAIYGYVNEMKFWVISNPLPAVGGLYSMYMYALNPNPIYPTLKYTNGFIGIRVVNIHNYRAIIEILECNWMELEYGVQDYPPNWA